jgi:hypothetical protein
MEGARAPAGSLTTRTKEEGEEVLELTDDGLGACAVERAAVECGDVEEEGEEDGALEVDLEKGVEEEGEGEGALQVPSPPGEDGEDGHGADVAVVEHRELIEPAVLLDDVDVDGVEGGEEVGEEEEEVGVGVEGEVLPRRDGRAEHHHADGLHDLVARPAGEEEVLLDHDEDERQAAQGGEHRDVDALEGEEGDDDVGDEDEGQGGHLEVGGGGGGGGGEHEKRTEAGRT